MTVKVKIPFMLRQHADNKKIIESEAGTIMGALNEITQRYPDLRNKIFDKDSVLKTNLNIYVNNKIVENRNLNKKVKDKDEILILLTLAGG